MTTQLYVGTKKKIERPKGGYLLIDDNVSKLPDKKRPRYFEPARDKFNPLQSIDHRKAQELAHIFYTVSPQGESTLTVRNGRRELRNALMRAKRLDDILTDDEIPKDQRDEVQGIVGDVLFSPVLRRMLCEPPNFTFNRNCVNLARINRAELGEDDALVIGLLLMAQFKGQIVVPDGGFYLRDCHASLIREDRLIVGVNMLSELPSKLRQSFLLSPNKTGAGCTYEDACTLAKYAGLAPDTVAHGEFLGRLMSQ
jgi:hypothetical protein